MTIRSAFYVDGFNFYHAVADLNEPFLKWCNLRKLADILIPKQTETVVKVVYCSAYYPGDSNKRWRHEEYRKALEAVGVHCEWGHYVKEDAECKACGDQWKKPTEKETDINVALSLYHDAITDVFDIAYLITADSDQAATARMLKRHCPSKKLITVAPPGRNFSTSIANFADGRISLTKEHLDKAVFPSVVHVPDHPLARRPKEYEPPDWWVHPDSRPEK